MDEINYQLTILNNHCKFNTFINVWLAGTSPLAPWRLANHCHLGSLVGGWALPLRKRWWSHLGWWHSQYDGKVKKIRGSKPPTKWFIMICCMFFCNSSWFIIISLFHSYPWDGIRSEKTSTNHGARRVSAPPSKEKDLCCRACGKKNRMIRDAEGRVGQPLDNNYYNIEYSMCTYI